MAVSSREAAIAALHALISTALASHSPEPQVLRSETVPQRLAPGGLVMIHDGETVEETAILSPLRWQVRHVAEVVVADRTLGGAVEWAQPESPSFDTLDFDGAASVRAASVPVSLWFTTSETPLS